MNPLVTAVRAGLARGRIEFRQTLTDTQTLMQYLFPALIFAVVMYFMRGSSVPGTSFSLGAMTMPSVLGMNVAFTGFTTLAAILIIEREDGTLLRAKAVPGGMVGYLVGRVVLVSSMTLIGLVLVLVPGLLMFDMPTDPVAWLTLAGVVILGLLASMPLGAIVGSLFSNPRNMGLVMLPTMGLVGISGIFYPITQLPQWLQWIAQVFPMYWMGLGTRAALLPADLAAVEIGGSWRHLQTVGVLGLWAVVGLTVAPVVLRRMARRESGSSVAARREKAMQRIT